jgi:hypothetical protein
VLGIGLSGRSVGALVVVGRGVMLAGGSLGAIVVRVRLFVGAGRFVRSRIGFFRLVFGWVAGADSAGANVSAGTVAGVATWSGTALLTSASAGGGPLRLDIVIHPPTRIPASAAIPTARTPVPG